jgi:hypothetical protein
MSSFKYGFEANSTKTLTDAEVYYDAEVTKPDIAVPIAMPTVGEATVHDYHSLNESMCGCKTCRSGGCCRRRRRHNKRRVGFCPFALVCSMNDKIATKFSNKHARIKFRRKVT